MPPRPRRLLAAAIIAAAGVAATATPAHANDPAVDTTRYVALGDSFVSGPLVPDLTGNPLGCLRSTGNYPSLLADDLGIDEFVDVSCSGAETEDMFAPQSTLIGTNDPQLDAVTAETTLVTITIGGNDLGFAGILVDCVTKGALNPLGSPCKDDYTADGDELRDRIADTAPKVDDVLAAVTERAPTATVALVGYPAILPETNGCWPKVTIARGDIGYLDGIEQELNAMLADAAAAHGVTYVDTFQRGHDVCQDESTRWIEAIIPTQWAAPVHPNALGMSAMADMVADALT